MGLSALQNLRVMIEMIVDKGGDEVIAMIVVGMATQRERLPDQLTGRFKQVRMQLHFQEVVG